MLPELAVALGAAAVFAFLAMAVMSGSAGGFDMAVRGHIHALSLPALTFVMRGFTLMGEAGFLLPFGGLIVWQLIAGGRRRDAAYLAAAAFGAEAIDQALKACFQRPRPEAFFGLAPDNYSFPSGHALVSLCFYVVLAETVIEKEWSNRRRLATRAGAVLFAGAIGLSRIYLGVHYPTDVLAGYAAAVAWLAILRCFIGSDLRKLPPPVATERIGSVKREIT